MSFMNGGFRWTVLISLALGTWLAGTVATLELRARSDRHIAREAALNAIASSDSLMTVFADSIMTTQAQMMATLEILRNRGYRLNDDITDLEAAKKKHAQGRSARDERRRWP